MIILEVIAVGGLQLAAAPAALVDLHPDLAAPDVVLPVGPLGQHQHHLHRVHRALVGEAAVGRGIAGAATSLHHHVVRHDLPSGNNNQLSSVRLSEL